MLEELLNQLDVGLFGILRGCALERVPGVPLGSTDLIKDPWALRVTVADSCLLEELVQRQLGIIVQPT